ncbi:MAG TPA: hypothetical protein VER03_20505, partial [Bryobacteraceae bacterium]|nr:hypothetical protein [Bryobacteraceae bacterium]
RVEAIETLNREFERVHQLASLTRDIAVKHRPEPRLQRKQPAVEEQREGLECCGSFPEPTDFPA